MNFVVFDNIWKEISKNNKLKKDWEMRQKINADLWVHYAWCRLNLS